MSTEAEKLWERLASELRRKKGFCPLTPEQAQKELDSLPDDQMSEDEIDQIVDAVTSGQLISWTPGLDVADLGGNETTEIEHDVMQLYRNPGESDAGVDDLVERLRREADEEADDADAEAEADQDGMAGDSEPPGEGG